MRKGLKVFMWSMVSLLVLVIVALGVYFLWPWNSKFFAEATKEFDIPGLDTAFTPQGMTKIEGTDKFLISGYMSDGTASRFYIVDSTTDEFQYFTLKVDGEDYVGHAGGVEVEGNKVWTVSGDDGGYCYVFNLDHALSSEDGDFINVITKFETHNGADFVFANNDLLWIGEFYKKGTYDTSPDHEFKTTSGEINRALVFAYTIDLNNSTGVSNNTPIMALSIRDLCQGIAVTNDGQFILSTSYSLPDSNIYLYEDVLDGSRDGVIKVNNTSVPVWFLDNNALISQTNAPSMSEEVVFDDGKVYILFESACQKYKLFNRKKLTNVYSLEMEILLNNK